MKAPLVSRLEATLAASGAIALIAAAASWQLIRADAGTASGGEPTQHRGVTGATLQQRTLLLDEAAPLELAALDLVTDTGEAFDPAVFDGRWSLVYLGFTSCPHVCPMTLRTLTAFAGLPASHVAETLAHADGEPAAPGDVQLVFLTVDPERDTAERMHQYLAAYDADILGVTGPRAHIDAAIGAFRGGYTVRDGGAGYDHSTALFAVDPRGRLAGLILTQPSAPAVARDLATIMAAANPGP